jgi:hypothetical protein
LPSMVDPDASTVAGLREATPSEDLDLAVARA